MKTLNLHCDYINFKALKKALRSIDEIAPNQKLEGESKDCLVVLTAIEKGDSLNSVKELTDSIKKIATDVKAENIVLYPYAHLSSNLGKPELAIKILNDCAKNLKPLNVIKAPFGYYKEFELKVKGHPLSELSREIRVGGNEAEEDDITEEERTKLLREISKSTLDTSKLMDNDHRIIGKKMNLWSFNPVAPGMVFWHSKGLHVKNQLIDYWREMHRREGYEEISTPQIMDKKLWEISGHWKLYKDNNFKTSYEKRDFLVKPMNCPGGMLVYQTSPKTYKDLPLRVGELGLCHRVELSGVLAGLFRVIQFTQDDAHIFCDNKQLPSEIIGVLKLFQEMLNTFGFNEYRYTISVRSKKKADKYLGTDKQWTFAENALAEGLKALGVKYSIEEGEAKFYGPSLDVQIKDSLGREWQCSTLQLDFNLPKRFNITYSDEEGKDQIPFMLHRVVLGSFERFLGVYTEHINGKFPLWLSPNQVKVMTLNDHVNDYANKVYKKLFEEGLEVEINDKSESMGKKAMEAQVQRFNYLLTVGEKEKAEGKIAVRARDSKEIVTMDLDEFISKVKEEIKERK